MLQVAPTREAGPNFWLAASSASSSIGEEDDDEDDEDCDKAAHRRPMRRRRRRRVQRRNDEEPARYALRRRERVNYDDDDGSVAEEEEEDEEAIFDRAEERSASSVVVARRGTAADDVDDDDGREDESTSSTGREDDQSIRGGPLDSDRPDLNCRRGSRRRGGEFVEGGASVDEEATLFGGVAGLEAQVAALDEMVLLPLRHPEIFGALGVQPPRGVLFHGPPGTGKTLLARELAAACALARGGQHVGFFVRNGGEVLSKYVGEAEAALAALFRAARDAAPSIIFFDEIDGLAPARSGGGGGGDGASSSSSSGEAAQNSVVATLLALMDGLEDRGQVVVIGATNRIGALDPALRRPGRFDRELSFDPPNAAQRRNILDLHTRAWRPLPQAAVLDAVAQDLTPGFCGAHLRALCADAAMLALRRARPGIFLLKNNNGASSPSSKPRRAAGDGGFSKKSKRLISSIRVEAADFERAARESSSRTTAALSSSRPLAPSVVARPLPTHFKAWLEAAVLSLTGAFPSESASAGGGEEGSVDRRAVAASTVLRRAAALYGDSRHHIHHHHHHHHHHRTTTTHDPTLMTAVAVSAAGGLGRARDAVASAVLAAVEARTGTKAEAIGLGALLQRTTDGPMSMGFIPVDAALASVFVRAAVNLNKPLLLYLPSAASQDWCDASAATDLRAALGALLRDRALAGGRSLLVMTCDDADTDLPVAPSQRVHITRPSRAALDDLFHHVFTDIHQAFVDATDAALDMTHHSQNQRRRNAGHASSEKEEKDNNDGDDDDEDEDEYEDEDTSDDVDASLDELRDAAPRRAALYAAALAAQLRKKAAGDDDDETTVYDTVAHLWALATRRASAPHPHRAVQQFLTDVDNLLAARDNKETSRDDSERPPLARGSFLEDTIVPSNPVGAPAGTGPSSLAMCE